MPGPPALRPQLPGTGPRSPPTTRRPPWSSRTSCTCSPRNSAPSPPTTRPCGSTCAVPAQACPARSSPRPRQSATTPTRSASSTRCGPAGSPAKDGSTGSLSTRGAHDNLTRRLFVGALPSLMDTTSFSLACGDAIRRELERLRGLDPAEVIAELGLTTVRPAEVDDWLFAYELQLYYVNRKTDADRVLTYTSRVGASGDPAPFQAQRLTGANRLAEISDVIRRVERETISTLPAAGWPSSRAPASSATASTSRASTSSSCWECPPRSPTTCRPPPAPDGQRSGSSSPPSTATTCVTAACSTSSTRHTSTSMTSLNRSRSTGSASTDPGKPPAACSPPC